MNTNQHNLLIYLPGILWLFAGVKLLLKASRIVYDPVFSFRLFFLLAMGAWIIASLKYRYVLSKSVSYQRELAHQLTSNNISTKNYIKKSFLSKRIFILLSMMLMALLIRNFINNPAILFFIRSTIGYSLIKAATTYFSKHPNALSTNL
ncbi:hypothetical protein BOKEGFJH_00268 [Chlamydia avium]|uniref:Inner membrane protein n=1 Tax=Chlamydia avium 10DC88 TaxID=1229831 RepID=W8JZU8_9CHLA|nr:hypothetical protein [Chlamydia avium]AHK63147.1 Putative inner membrane protein [Chlamydia avium 10DC88]VVT42756.1 hypothetical protein BOKEGFJH_00268 [Chlamydia avium]